MPESRLKQGGFSYLGKSENPAAERFRAGVCVFMGIVGFMRLKSGNGIRYDGKVKKGCALGRPFAGLYWDNGMANSTAGHKTQ